MLSPFPVTVDVGRLDFTTYLSGMFPSLTQDGPSYLVAPPGSLMY
jgi:hypothetical protein